MAFDPGRVRAVLFDIDGTLRDTDDELVHRGVRLLRRPLGEERAARFTRRVIMRCETPLQHFLSLADRLTIDGFVNRLIARLGRATHGPSHLVPGARELLEGLAGRYRLGVVSAGPAVLVERFLAEHDLRGVMEVVISGQTHRRTKPHPEPVRAGAWALGCRPDEAVMVGDTTVDIKSGRRAGAQTIGLLTGFGERKELERAGAHIICTTLADVAALFGPAPPEA